MKKLENKVAVITGGNSGIGLATAKLFAQEGAKVAITGRDLQTLTRSIKEVGHDALGIISDVSSIGNIDSQYQKVNKTFGNIDVLVLNAGVYTGGKLADMTEEQFDELNDINFKGVFFSIQKALPYLNDKASVIITSSSLSTMGMPGVSAYSASKAAVHSLAKSLSNELADRKIRVNVISPGPVTTPIIGRGGATDEQVEKMKAGRASRTVIKRMGEAEEIAAGMLYLASDDSRFMLGSELVLDGGMRIL